MSNVISLIPRQLKNKCISNNIEWSEGFSERVSSYKISNQKLNRVIRFFIKKSPERLIVMLEKKGYSKDESLSTLFSRRFGKYLVIYKFKNKMGKITLELLELVKLITKNLYAVATHFSYIAQGGEVMFYNSFEVYSCDPVLCMDPIKRFNDI